MINAILYILCTGCPWRYLPSEAVRYDGGKRVKGRKRNLLVDSLGLLLMVVVTAANCSEGAGLRQLLAATEQRGVALERLVTILVDGGYQGEASTGSVGHGLLALGLGGSTPPARSLFCIVALAVGGGTNLWLVAAESSFESGL